MRRLIGFGFILFVLLSATFAHATMFIINFQGLTDGEEVGNFYQAEGITFIGFTAVAGHYYECQGTDETCSASVADGAIMNVAPGFEGGLSFYFANGGSADVRVYDGLNGQGTLLIDYPLWPAHDPWEPFGFTFNGVAKSAVFNGGMEVAVLTTGGGMVIPEPAGILLFTTALGSLGLIRRRTS